MTLGQNISRRDAWLKVSQYAGLWLIAWLVIGLAVDADNAPDSVIDGPMPPVLVDMPQTLRGRVQRSVTMAVSNSVRAQPKNPVVSERPQSSTAMPLTTTPDVRSGLTDSGEAGFFADAPPGFADLIGVQNTEADVFFQGRLLISSFIEFDLEHVWFLAPEEVIEAIPTLKNPERVLDALTGQLDSHSHLLCNRRVRDNCGDLDPEVAGILFDEGRFRIDLFIDPSELAVQMLVGDRYLPAPSASWATLHDLSVTAAGQRGINRFTGAGESFLSKGSGRLRVRYGVTNTGPAIHEGSWQWDSRDRELEVGVFRGSRGNSVFINDKRLLGMRMGTTTKTRTDLDNALATPILIFLERRARVDILRGNEVLDSRFYDAGNHQLNTTRLPDGAYDITVRSVAADGREDNQQHFFVRNSLLPPMDEQQFYLEAGAFTDEYGSSMPRTVGGGWLRGGTSRRINEHLALEGEAMFSSETNLLQGGAYVLGRGWQLHAGLMASERGDKGFSVRGQFQRKRVSLSVNAQHLDSKTGQEEFNRFDSSLTSNVNFSGIDALSAEAADPRFLNEQGVVGGSYTQASAALSFPLEIPLWNGTRSKGQANLRAQYNQRNGLPAQKGIGFNYSAPLFRRSSIAADWNFESLYSSDRSLVRFGVDFRWRTGQQSSFVRPDLIASQVKDPFSGERDAFTVNPSLNASWNRSRRTERLGDVNEGVYLTHQGGRSVLGGRLASQSDYGYADLDVAYAQGAQDGLQYVANTRFNLVSKEGKTALGGGRSQLAAIVVEIDGDLPDSDFQILVGNRVAGYASTTKRGVVSLRPYDTYKVRVSPTGADILGYDEQAYEVTLFPGNVHHLVFKAHELRVLVSQALAEDGSPVTFGKFMNIDGYGLTDAEGWFQIEVSHGDDLQVRKSDGSFCAITPPAPTAEEDGLAVLDALVCRAIPVPPSA